MGSPKPACADSLVSDTSSGEHEVACERDLEAAACGHAVDRCDQRLRAVIAARDRGKSRARVDPVMPVCRRLCGRMQVVAGAERAVAGAGDDRQPSVGVGLEVIEDLDQLAVGMLVESVHPFRPVERHVGDVTLLLVDDVLVAHARGLNFGTATASFIRSNVTSSGIPISSRSFGQSTTWLVSRTPSSVSTTAMLYGISAANASS